MRECWINVYPYLGEHGRPHLGLACKTPERANSAASGFEQVEPGELFRLGVGYRLHVRLKPERGLRLDVKCHCIDRTHGANAECGTCGGAGSVEVRNFITTWSP